MAKFLVETYYNCSFKVSHYLDEISENEFQKLEKREDGKFEILDLKLENRSIVFDYSAYILKEVNLEHRTFNIIFLDPPFKDSKIKSLVDQIKKLKVADENSLLVIHRNKKSEDNISQYLNVIDEKNYGLSKIFFCKLI